MTKNYKVLDSNKYEHAKINYLCDYRHFGTVWQAKWKFIEKETLILKIKNSTTFQLLCISSTYTPNGHFMTLYTHTHTYMKQRLFHIDLLISQSASCEKQLEQRIHQYWATYVYTVYILQQYAFKARTLLGRPFLLRSC